MAYNLMELDLDKVDRNTALQCWMVYHGIEKKKIAQDLNITPSMVSRFISGKSKSSTLRRAFLMRGVPEELLV